MFVFCSLVYSKSFPQSLQYSTVSFSLSFSPSFCVVTCSSSYILTPPSLSYSLTFSPSLTPSLTSSLPHFLTHSITSSPPPSNLHPPSPSLFYLRIIDQYVTECEEHTTTLEDSPRTVSALAHSRPQTCCQLFQLNALAYNKIYSTLCLLIDPFSKLRKASKEVCTNWDRSSSCTCV